MLLNYIDFSLLKEGYNNIDYSKYEKLKYDFFETRDIDTIREEDWSDDSWDGWDYINTQKFPINNNGNVVMYHGSKKDFNNFSTHFYGSNAGLTGAGGGFYFTNIENDSHKYGEFIYKCELLLKNSLSNDEVTTNSQVILNVLDVLEKCGYNYFENFYGESVDKIVKNCLSYSDDDAEVFSNISNSVGNAWEIISKILSKMNINHITSNNPYKGEGQSEFKHIIMYNPDDIKILGKVKREI